MDLIHREYYFFNTSIVIRSKVMKSLSARILLTALCICFFNSPSIHAADNPILWATDCLTKVMPNALPGDGIPYLAVSGAKGETVSGQAVYYPGKPVAHATCSITDLRHSTGQGSIPSASISLQWVRYIDISRNTEGIPEDELVATAPGSIPDPFWEEKTIPVEFGTRAILNESAFIQQHAQPLWIEIDVPQDARPGDYRGTLTIISEDHTVRMPVKLLVWDFEVPEERHLAVINWWTFPGMGFDAEEGSPEYYRLLRQFAEFVVAHRQTNVWAFFSLITESGDSNSGYTYDTDKLERYAETCFDAGIRTIHMHTLARKTKPILDTDGVVAPIDENFRKLPALSQMIKHRGWEGRFIAALTDEPFIHHERTFAELVERVHREAPGIRIIEALEAEYLGALDIYVPKLSHLNMWYPRFDAVRQEGSELWFYTCCHPVGRYPNRFLDQSLLKVRVLHWINYLYNITGYLHWGLNMQWDGDGDAYTMEAVSNGLPLGDRAIAYPGKKGLLGSLRFSAQRDGLEDYEYLWTLEQKLREVKERTGEDAFWLNPRQRPLELCKRVISTFYDYTRDNALFLDTRRKIAQEIENIDANPMLIVQTSPPEGTTIPNGPRFLHVRGLTTPGATVEINGEVVKNVLPSGYFYAYHFLKEDTPVVTVTVEKDGIKRTAERTFGLGE